jgi:hypothetical protein
MICCIGRKVPQGKHKAVSKAKQVPGADSESEEAREALSEVLADHSTEERKIHPFGKVGNEALRTH